MRTTKSNKQTGKLENLSFLCCPSMTLLYVYLNQAGIKFRVEKNHTFCRCLSTSCLYVYSDQTGIKLNVINSPHHHNDFFYILLCLRNVSYFAISGKFKKLNFNSPEIKLFSLEKLCFYDVPKKGILYVIL